MTISNAVDFRNRCHFLGKVKVTIVTGDFRSACAQLGFWFHCESLNSINKSLVDFCSSSYYYYQNILLLIDFDSSAMSPSCFSTHIWEELWSWLMTWLNHSQHLVSLEPDVWEIEMRNMYCLQKHFHRWMSLVPFLTICTFFSLWTIP